MSRIYPIPRISLFLIGSVLILAVLGVYVSTYQRSYLDYASGRTRTDHMVGPFHWRSTYSETWITIFIAEPGEEDWHFVGYRKQKLIRTMVNSAAGKIGYRLNSLNSMLNMYPFDNRNRDLIANWVVDLLGREGSDVAVFVAAERSFEHFQEHFPYPESEKEVLTSDQLAQLILDSTVEVDENWDIP